MIVELVGPPGVGKSTFTRALATLLRERGHAVDPVMSYRPAEYAPASARGWAQAADAAMIASLRRLIRPVVEMLASAGLFGRPTDTARIAELLRLLPPKNPLWALRLRQYLFRLCHAWQIALESHEIVLFDQAFVQAVCSLVVLGRAVDRARIEQAISILPPADLLIRLDAPRDILAARLDHRQHSQGRIERLFELDLQTNLEFGVVVDELQPLLLARGHSLVSVNSADPQSLQNGVTRAEAYISAKLGTIRARDLSTAEIAPELGNNARDAGQAGPA